MWGGVNGKGEAMYMWGKGMTITGDLYKRYLFFKEHAGYCVGQRAVGALQLARAEIWAEEQELEACWEWDDNRDLGDHEYWCAEARRRKAERNWDGSYRWTGREEYCEHEVEQCLLYTRDEDCIASLSGIIDADRSYRRVIEAELASEALYEEQRCKNIMAL